MGVSQTKWRKGFGATIQEGGLWGGPDFGGSGVSQELKESKTQEAEEGSSWGWGDSDEEFGCYSECNKRPWKIGVLGGQLIIPLSPVKFGNKQHAEYQLISSWWKLSGTDGPGFGPGLCGLANTTSLPHWTTSLSSLMSHWTTTSFLPKGGSRQELSVSSIGK